MNKLKLMIILLLATGSINAMAQQSTPDTAKHPVKALFFNAGLQYISNLTYAGRKDESSVPILLPTFTLISKSGLFISGIGYFDLSGANSNAEGFSVTPGYVFSFDDKKEFGGAISATKYFITNSSPIILSSFNASIDGQLSYDPKVIKLTIGGSYRIGKDNQNDIINNAELSKEIQIVKTGAAKKDGLKITPTATLYGGTQSFSETYYTNSQVQRAVDDPSPTNPLNILFPSQTKQTIITETVTQQSQAEVKKYNLLAASGSMPITYTLNKWQFSATPYFIKPLNQVDYASNTAMNGVYFLFTTGVSVTF
jgi:hypothetical protein